MTIRAQDPFASGSVIPAQTAPPAVVHMPTLEQAEAQLAYLADLQHLNHQVIAAHQERNTPPRHRVLDFTPTYLTHRDDVGDGWEALSFAVYNAYPVKVYVGVGGASPAPGTGSIELPGKSFVVMPLHLLDVELAADATDIAALPAPNVATVHFLRFKTVQPAFMQVLA